MCGGSDCFSLRELFVALTDYFKIRQLKGTKIQYLWPSGIRSTSAGWFSFCESCEGSFKVLAGAAVF